MEEDELLDLIPVVFWSAVTMAILGEVLTLLVALFFLLILFHGALMAVL